MSRFRFCLLLAVICSCSQYGLADITTPKTILIPVGPQHEAEPEKVPEIVTEPPATAKPTTKPTTTTTSTTTTPSTTTTTTTTTSTTTPAPTTTSAPTPAPAPGPLPPPDKGTWTYKDAKTNVTCIVVQFAAQLNVTYNKKVNNVTSLAFVRLNVPVNATVVDGSCDGDQWLQLSWNTSNVNATLPNNMTLVYHKNETTKNYALKSLNISLASENFVNSSSSAPIELNHGPEWEIPLATSYRCKPATLLKLSSDSAATLTLSQLQEEAYRTTNGTEFSAARECGGNDVPDAVPIAVGCALGGLVVVVLVAYLVGRRRSAARGYLSM